MRARYYNPDLKRFMNRDVVSGNIIESQTLNRYAFVNGNPISYHDPFGLAREAIANANMSLMDRLHIGLDIAGTLPVIGGVADGLNAVLYLSKGDYTNALLSGMAMIPVVGNASTVAKYADNVAFLGKKGYNKVAGLQHKRQNTSSFGKYSTNIDDKVRVVDKQELPDWVKDSFIDGNYRTVVTKDTVTLYRTFGGGAKIDGSFATTRPAGNRINAKLESALVPDWKNSREFEAVIEVPKGQFLNIGKVEKQYTKTGALLQGGGDQILLPRGWSSDWIKEVRRVSSR